MSGQVMTVAGAMFMIPLVVLMGIAIVSEIPGWMLFIGGWSMLFSIVVGAIGIFIGMNGG